jgi:hypothetical protein
MNLMHDGIEIEPGDIEFHTADEWTAVYVHGKLVRVGDTYLADEWLQELVGVRHVSGGGFLRGQRRRDGVAKTLEEISEYEEERNRKLEELARLKKRISDLESELGS